MKATFSILIIAFIGAVAIPAMGQNPRSTPTPTTSRPTATPSTPRPTPTPAVTNLPVPQTRIALIDTSRFGDEQNGIYRYVDAARVVQNEFKPRTDEIQNLESRLNALANELDALVKANPVDQKAVQAKQQQGQTLQDEYNTKKEKLNQDVAKRYEQVVSPISAQIGSALDQFATARGVTMTLDMSKLMPAILTLVQGVDLTQAFISEFNSKYPRTAAPTPRP